MIDLALDDRLRVAVSGLDCTADELTVDDWISRGSDLAALYSALADSYRTGVIARLDAGVSPSTSEIR